jgi:hypothetical protein
MSARPASSKWIHPEQFPVVTATGIRGNLGSERNRRGRAGYRARRPGDLRSPQAASSKSTRLGDTVTKGQLLLRVQSNDIAQAYSDYRQAVADEVLAKAQLERSKILLDKGAIAQKDYEVAVDVG